MIHSARCYVEALRRVQASAMPRAQQFSFDESQSKKTPSGMENQGTEGRSNSAIVTLVSYFVAPRLDFGQAWNG
ncbi:hypothetical protein HYQ44_002195 [Verticillium longisporum]|nr:hypothetical protein HYQ44_002195 [Verticillium longisporum]